MSTILQTSFADAFGLTDRDCVCISGGGGKTSLLFCLQSELKSAGTRSLVTTTAKMMVPEDQPEMFYLAGMDGRQAEYFADVYLRSEEMTAYLGGGIQNGKVSGIPESALSIIAGRLKGRAAVLAETDGAGRKPYRIRKPHDPGIPSGTTLVIHVIGAELFGAELNGDNVNRCSDDLSGRVADARTIRLLLEENRAPNPDGVPEYLFVNKADIDPDRASGIAEAAGGLFDRIFTGSVKQNQIREIKNDKIVSLVLGAGLSRRMAGFTDDKLSLPWKSGTILGETIANVRRTTGMNPAVVTQEGRKTPGAAFTAVNPDPRRGQGSSLGIGINKIASVCPDAAGVLVYLGDQPEISRETASRVLREVLEHPGSIVNPEHNEKPGHPVFFPAAIFNELSELDGEEAGKSVLRSNPDKVRRIACGPDCTRDIDTPEAYRRLMEEQQMEEFKRSSEKKSIDRDGAGEAEDRGIDNLIIVRGAGDLATGTILKLHRAGFPVLALDIANPTVIRRTVSLAPALTLGEAVVENEKAVRCKNEEQIRGALADGLIPVAADPDGILIEKFKPAAVVDAILAKRNLGTTRDMAPVVVGLGPGFTAGEDVDAVVETKRGHDLGRVIYDGAAVPNTGVPGMIGGYAKERVVHSPASGTIRVVREIGSHVGAGETIAEIVERDGTVVPVHSKIDGILRGMIEPGSEVTKGLKIADTDPRDVAQNCHTVSDKANAIAGGVLEAVMHLQNEAKKAAAGSR